jgi:hypothetical protein
VAKALSMAQLKQLAAHGARARLAELRAEIASITRAFPDVADAAAAAVTGRRRRRRRRAALVHESEPARNDPNPQARHRPTAYDAGLPR